jgi:hypothetical protein
MLSTVIISQAQMVGLPVYEMNTNVLVIFLLLIIVELSIKSMLNPVIGVLK